MTYNERLNDEAYKLVRYLYKNMPTYNQLKGTYAGMQYILNLMGLCTSITELWSTRDPDSLTHFKVGTLYRADYLNAVRQRINEWGNAKVEDFFLTSRFDIDMAAQKNITFKMFNGMAETVIDTVMQMKPVTRCLRRLYYILTINTNVHLEYMTDGISSDEKEISHFRYSWNLSTNPLSYKTEVDKENGNINTIFLPWICQTAEKMDKDAGTGQNTMKNTYFNLFDLDTKFERSGQKTLRFMLTGWTEGSEDKYTAEYILEIGKDVVVSTEINGIMLRFNGLAANMLYDLFGHFTIENLISEDTEDDDLVDESEINDLIPEDAVLIDDENNYSLSDKSIIVVFTMPVSTPLGSKYIYQDPEISLT